MLALGLVLGAVISIGGIALAYYIWVARPALAPAIAARFAPLTSLFEHKWYFDELIDALVVRPGAWFGRFAQNTFERLVVNGTLIGGTTGSACAPARRSCAATRAETGSLRRPLLPAPKLI